MMLTNVRHTYVSLQLRVQNAVSAQPCVGKLGISLVLLRYDTIGRIELIPSIVLSNDNTNYKNIIQLFLQLFDELSVYRDYH